MVVGINLPRSDQEYAPGIPSVDKIRYALSRAAQRDKRHIFTEKYPDTISQEMQIVAQILLEESDLEIEEEPSLHNPNKKVLMISGQEQTFASSIPLPLTMSFKLRDRLIGESCSVEERFEKWFSLDFSALWSKEFGNGYDPIVGWYLVLSLAYTGLNPSGIQTITDYLGYSNVLLEATTIGNIRELHERLSGVLGNFWTNRDLMNRSGYVITHPIDFNQVVSRTTNMTDARTRKALLNIPRVLSRFVAKPQAIIGGLSNLHPTTLIRIANARFLTSPRNDINTYAKKHNDPLLSLMKHNDL